LESIEIGLQHLCVFDPLRIFSCQRKAKCQYLRHEGVTVYNQEKSARKKAYGCISVRVGDETKSVQMIEKIFPDIQAHAITQIKHKSRNGTRSYSSEIMMPGYIVFMADEDAIVSRLLKIRSVFRVLTYTEREWQLRGADLFYAEWIFQNHGEIGVSRVFMKNDKIQVVDGPLKNFEGEIVTVDKRNRNAQVIMGFHRQTYKVWLAFEWIDKIEQLKKAKNKHGTVYKRTEYDVFQRNA
jgi:transcriptional antiterminator NusG